MQTNVNYVQGIHYNENNTIKHFHALGHIYTKQMYILLNGLEHYIQDKLKKSLQIKN